jgi:hypothetical protein
LAAQKWRRQRQEQHPVQAPPLVRQPRRLAPAPRQKERPLPLAYLLRQDGQPQQLARPERFRQKPATALQLTVQLDLLRQLALFPQVLLV